MSHIKKNSHLYLNCFYFLFLFLLFNYCEFVYATANYNIVCNNGFLYQVDNNFNGVGIPLEDFYQNTISFFHTYGENDKDPGWRQSSLNGKTFRYASLGTYNNKGDSKSSVRCYTVQENNSYESTTRTTYTPKVCGSNFAIDDLEFQTSATNLADYPNQTIDPNNGTVTLTIKPKEGSSIAKVWDRLMVASRKYEGVSSDGVTGIGNYQKLGNNYGGQAIIISGIIPSKLTSTSSTYEISLYINGIKTEDFTEISGDKNNYINSCGGSSGGYYLGKLTVSIIPETKAMLNNPIINGTVCNEVRNFSNASSSIKEGYLSECYNSTIPYYMTKNLETTARDKFTTLKRIYEGSSNMKVLASEDNLLCTDTRMGIPSKDADSYPFETKIVYENLGEFFGMTCVESYYVNGGVPSLVKSGMGISYSNEVEVRKTCSIFQIKQASRPPQCVTTVSTAQCLPATGTNQTWTGGSNGGPSSAFDSCIANCDGGKYTQACINSCYQKEYQSNVTAKNVFTFSNSFLENYYLKNNQANVMQIASGDSSSQEITWNGYGNYDFGNYSVVVDPNAYYGGDYNKMGRADIIDNSTGEVIFSNGYSAYCDRYDNPCSVSISVGPPGCSDNPEADFQAQLSRARSELANYETLAAEVSKIENYTMSFIDSKNYNIYKISGSSLDGSKHFREPRLIIQKDEANSKVIRSSNTNYDLGEGNYKEGLNSNAISTIYNISLPKTYSAVGNSNVIAIKNNTTDEYYSYKNSAKGEDGKVYYQFNLLENDYPGHAFNNSIFSTGANVYYTNLYSDNFNVKINAGISDSELAKIAHAIVKLNDKTYVYSLANLYNNIEVELKVSNTDSHYSSFDDAGFYCYYGVYAIDIKPPEPELSCTSCPISGGEEIPDDKNYDGDDPFDHIGGSGVSGGSGGLRYYYREIKLTDVFPNDRLPRWNWTGTITYNGDGSTVVTGAANNSNVGYVVDPTRLIQAIENKGDSIFTNDSEVDYSYTLTPSLISDIRKYNKSTITENSKKRKITYLDYSLASNSIKNTYSIKIKEWLPDLNTTSITECNNATDLTCDDRSGGS